MVNAEPLTVDERAELDALRAAKNTPVSEHADVAARDAESNNRGNVTVIDGDTSKDTVNQPVKPEDEPLPDTHWLHLGDGRVINSKGVMSHYEGIPVIHAVEIPAELNGPATPAHRF